MPIKFLTSMLLVSAVFTVSAVLLQGVAVANEKAADEASELPVQFDRDIRPLFETHCGDCHTGEYAESNLRVDRRVSLLQGGDYGVPSIVPGKPQQSYLLEVIGGEDPDLRMPPDGELMSQQEVSLVRRWIELGAEWPGQMADTTAPLTSDHWSLQPIRRPEVPQQNNPADHPIDAFVLRKLRQNGLSPSPPADRATLLRRISLDLTGLPPTPEELAAFESDTDETPIAYGRVVERLLQSPRYGERWAQHWLDVIRYADTRGYEFNSVRPNAWPFRDYVIDSFNADKPWDQFIVEQIAGDALGVDPATGFLVTAPLATPAEVGQEPDQIKQARYNSLDEMVQNIGMSMLGLTVGCARCHNHKFDPVPMEDYYGLIACLEGVTYDDRTWRNQADAERIAALDATDRRIKEIRSELKQFPSWREKHVDHTVERFAPVDAKYVRMTVYETDAKRNGAAFDSIKVYSTPDGGRPDNVGASGRGAKATSSGAWEGAGDDEKIIDHLFGEKSIWISDKRPNPTNWVQIELAHSFPIHTVEWSRDRKLAKKNPEAHRIRLATDYKIEVAEVPGQWTTLVSRTREEGLSMQQIDRRRELEAELAGLLARLPELQDGPQVFAGKFEQPAPTRFFHRGDPAQPKHQVKPQALSVIGGMELDTDAPEQNRRMALAKWIASEDNPLTARVAVNRIWLHHFGTGLVSTPGDFGTQGAEPSHPELLDWLAAEFIDSGWSVKAMHRLIVTSKTYRQSNRPRPEAMTDDPTARLLWRFPPRRLEAEAIRDSLLYVAGTLDFEAGGPGFSVYRDKPNFGEWKPKESLGPPTWRRMIYMQKMRAADDGMFKVFDVPDCGQVRSKRSDSTTPLQSLNMFNGPFLYRHAVHLAERVQSDCGSDASPSDLADRLFRVVLSRQPDPSERQAVADVIRNDSLTTAARAILNTNEFLFLP